MTFRLAADDYGKAGIRLVHVDRCADQHEVRDLCVDVSLAGRFAEAHIAGDNTAILPTDTQKNTVYAFAAEHGIGEIEDFALQLARHFVASHEPAMQARVAVEEYGWDRVGPHSFRGRGETRITTVTHRARQTRIVSGTSGLTLLNTAGSEFTGFAADRYTTLRPATDRLLSTSVTARWAAASQPIDGAIDWGTVYADVRRHLVDGFAQTYSYSLQHTLYAMATRVLEQLPVIAWVHLSLPNRHHDVVDLTRIGLANDGAVFAVPDRPHGLIRATVARDGVADEEWQSMVHGA